MAREETLKFSLIDAVSAGFSKIADGVGKIKTTFTELNQAAELASKGIGLVRDVAAGIGGAVSGVASLEDAFAALQAVTGASTEDFEKLKAAAIDASERTRFSAVEAAGGLAELARAGFDATGAISALGPTLALAQGQGLSVGESVQFLTTTLTQFGLAASEAGRVADVFASAADKSQLDVRQLASSMSYAAPIANQLGMSLEETTAIIGKLADEGFRGERGGTALTNALTALLDPSSKFSKALDDAGIKSRKFTEVIQALADRGDGAKKILLALDASATPAITALATKGSEGITLLNEALNNVSGSAQRTSDILGDTFNGALARLQNTLTNARNAFLEPLLSPLADEFDRLGEKVRAFAESEQFARLSAQVTGFVTDAVRELGDFVQAADFSAIAASLIQFGQDMRVVFGVLADVASATAATFRLVGDAVDYIDEQYLALRRALGETAEAQGDFSRSSQKLGDVLRAAREEAAKAPGALRAYKVETKAAAESSDFWETTLRGLIDRTKDFVRQLGQMPEPAKLFVKSAEEMGTAAIDAAIAFERLQVSTFSAAIADLARANLQGTDTFRALVAEVGAAEARINKLTEEQGKLAKANKDTADTANNAANSLRNMASAASDAGSAAERTASSNSQVADSFGNIGKQAAAAAADLGNMSRELLDMALAMQAQATNGQQIIDIWAGITRQYEESNKRIQQAIDLAERQNAATSEEARIRRQLEAQYGTDSTLLEKLVQLRLQENREREKSIELADREAAAIERANAARAGQLGGFGAQPAAGAETPSATGGRGTAGGEGARGPVQVTVNVQGMTTDQAREFVERSVVPELERINRLSR